MRIFILSAWQTEEGEVRINGIDFNETLGGNSFTDTKDWKPMLSEWNAYVGEEFVDRNDDEDGNEEGEAKESRKQRRRKEEFALEMDTYGLPIIPDIECLNPENKKSLIRTFLTKHYSILQGFAVKAKGSLFLDLQKIKDLSKLQLHEANQLLEFRHQRQKDKVQPTFEFKGWQDHDKEVRELVEKISRRPTGKSTGKSSRKSTRKLTRKSTRKSTGKSSGKSIGRVEQESGSEGEDGDEDEGDETGKSTGKSSSSEGEDGDEDEGDETRKLTGKSCGKPTRRAEQESSSGGENGDEDRR
ncbi:hypothetical protein DFJ58DRAFT_734280 [Suillus subalutaceus]|uniref:uncharacterized protein n=1 Tax=Suillus subalutaceus TaxID=48586 RepID=UPI001B882D38|nr:uncharacterized protein DFJ58DRAFT_734280 [Suillus subalutaceus]KAG1837565.1 hypothetical protein DFJ58DRAFT_734280 [Suillus subalutaceus]